MKQHRTEKDLDLGTCWGTREDIDGTGADILSCTTYYRDYLLNCSCWKVTSKSVILTLF